MQEPEDEEAEEPPSASLSPDGAEVDVPSLPGEEAPAELSLHLPAVLAPLSARLTWAFLSALVPPVLCPHSDLFSPS